MLDKYQHFKKLSKTQGCSFYDAEDRTSMQNVLIKRLQQKCSWDQLLNNRNVQYLSKAKFAPKMVEIFKKKRYYFIVFEKPTGLPLSEPESIGKLPLSKFFPLFNDICENSLKLKQIFPQVYILPQWVFINRNSCKIAHFQPFLEGEQNQMKKHVFMYNLEKSMLQSVVKQTNDSDAHNFERKQSLIFNLGAIAYHLLTGTKATNAETQEQYKQQLADLGENCYKRIFRVSNDEKLSELISKMIKQNPFDIPTISEIANFIKRKSKDYEPKYNTNPILQLELQRIKLTDKFRDAKQKKIIRPCCKTENLEMEVEVEKRGSLTVAYMRKSQHVGQSLNRSFLPQISPSNRHRFHSKSSRKDIITNASKPTMLKSQDHIRIKQLMQ